MSVFKQHGRPPSHAAPYLPVFSDGLYHIDQRSMTGIIVGVCIALACIVMCALILINKGRPRCWPRPPPPSDGQVPASVLHLSDSW